MHSSDNFPSLEYNKSKRKSLTNPFHESSSLLKNIHAFISSSKKRKEEEKKLKRNRSCIKAPQKNSPNHDCTASPTASLTDKLYNQFHLKEQNEVNESDVKCSSEPLARMTSSESVVSLDTQQPLQLNNGICLSPCAKKQVMDASINLPLVSPDVSEDESVANRKKSVIREISTQEKTNGRGVSNTIVMNNDNASAGTLVQLEPDTQSRPCHVRQKSSGFKREYGSPQPSKAKLRRIHSMFASRTEFSNKYDVDPLPPSTGGCDAELDAENDSEKIPVFESQLEESGIPFYYEDKRDDNLPRISVDTLVEIMDGRYMERFERFYIVDCRFEYEFEGGHIRDAMNISSQHGLEREFIHNRHERCKTLSDRPPLIIFHCEFSSYRSPIMASHLRNCDRVLNYENYPMLHYPDVIVLEGGYRSFFDKFKPRCFPCRYVGMDSQEHLDKCESEMEKFRKNSKRVITRENSFHIFNSSATLATVGSKFMTKSESTYDTTSTRCGVGSVQTSLTKKKNSIYKDSSETSNSLLFRYEAPPRLSLSRFNGLGGSTSSTSSSGSTPSSKMLLSDELYCSTGGFESDNFSFEEGDDSFQAANRTTSSDLLGAVKKSLFNTILKEEEAEESCKLHHKMSF